MKFNEAPEVTKSIYNVVDTLRLDHLFVVAPSRVSYPVDRHISVLYVLDCPGLDKRIAAIER